VRLEDHHQRSKKRVSEFKKGIEVLRCSLMMAASSDLAHILEQTLNPHFAKEGNMPPM
jgi:hypothetical protein